MRISLSSTWIITIYVVRLLKAKQCAYPVRILADVHECRAQWPRIFLQHRPRRIGRGVSGKRTITYAEQKIIIYKPVSFDVLLWFSFDRRKYIHQMTSISRGKILYSCSRVGPPISTRAYHKNVSHFFRICVIVYHHVVYRYELFEFSFFLSYRILTMLKWIACVGRPTTAMATSWKKNFFGLADIFVFKTKITYFRIDI